jgi:hypothetical protein
LIALDVGKDHDLKYHNNTTQNAVQNAQQAFTDSSKLCSGMNRNSASQNVRRQLEIEFLPQLLRQLSRVKFGGVLQFHPIGVGLKFAAGDIIDVIGSDALESPFDHVRIEDGAYDTVAFEDDLHEAQLEIILELLGELREVKQLEYETIASEEQPEVKTVLGVTVAMGVTVAQVLELLDNPVHLHGPNFSQMYGATSLAEDPNLVLEWDEEFLLELIERGLDGQAAIELLYQAYPLREGRGSTKRSAIRAFEHLLELRVIAPYTANATLEVEPELESNALSHR